MITNGSPLFKRAFYIKKIMKIAGGPGSNSSKVGRSIVNKFPQLKVSPIISISKRRKFMDKNSPSSTGKEIPVSSVKYVGQEKYLPSKIKKMVNFPELLNYPIDVIRDKNGEFHVMDGHHRFLASVLKNKRTIKANVYEYKLEV